MARGVLVVRLERVRERLDSRDERPLEPFVTRGVRDCEPRLVGETTEQPELASAEIVPLDEGDDAACAPVYLERRYGVVTSGDAALPDYGLVLRGLRDVRLGAAAERLDRVLPLGELC